MSSRTANLNLLKFEGSDTVNYNDFNGNFDIIDKMGVDYVTQKGTKGEWWYRVWRSGRAECGVDNLRVGNSGMSAWESTRNNVKTFTGFYISNAEFSFGNYPVSFVAPPYRTFSLNYIDNHSNIHGWIIQQSTPGQTTSPRYKVVSTFSDDFNGIQVGVFCTGRTS